MKTIHALLVGINDYKNIRPLTGCEKDVERLDVFLKKYTDGTFQYHSRSLTGQAASKQGIVTAFEEHLIQPDTLSEGDVLLFYFSGHGAEEEAEEVFWPYEANHKLQVLACYDSDLSNGKNFLADKELRYLIQQAAKPGVEVITIFDCCHSGDNTRALAPGGSQERLAGLVGKRNWEDFIFGKTISPEKIKTASLDSALPQGRHIQLAACNSHESAWEQNFIGGYFTSALLEILTKYRGDLSYLDIKNRAKNYVRSQYPQNPQIYAHPGGTDQDSPDWNDSRKMLFSTFLGGAVRDKPVFSEVYFNKQAQQWELDKGAVYGIQAGTADEAQNIVVSVSEEDQLFATVMKTYPGYSVVEFEPYADISTKERYEAYCPALINRVMPFSISGEAEGVAVFHTHTSKAALEKDGLKIAGPNDQAAYVVVAKEAAYFIMLPGTDQALTKQVTGYGQSSVQKVQEQLKHIQRWSFAKKLQANTASLLPKVISIKLELNGQEVQPKNGIYRLELQEGIENTLSLSVTNLSDQTLFLGAIFLSSLFGIVPHALWDRTNTVKPLDKNKTATNRYNIFLDDYIRELNWKEEQLYFQIVSGASEFSLDLYAQEDLERPERTRGEKPKGAIILESNSEYPPDNWRTDLISIHIANPDYSQFRVV